MKTKLLLAILFTLPLLFTSAQESNQKSVAITVYNSNLGVVKDLRSIDINSGISTIKLTDVAQHIDPTSVHIKLDGEILEQNYQYDLVSLDKILKKYLDKTIQLINENGELLEGTLLTANSSQIVLQKKDGGLLMLPNTNKYQISVGDLPEGLITKPTLVWMVKSSDSGKQDIEVSYQTSGMGWHAEYVAVLNKNDSKLSLNSWVSVDNNSGTTFKNAKLKLIAGDVNLVRNQRPNYSMMREDKLYAVADAAPQFEEKEFFEYHIYNLQRPTTLSNNETKQISLFEADDVKVNKKYLYKGSSSYRNNQNAKVSVIIEFKNEKSNNLSIPMPKGKVRVYKSDGDAVEFIGEDLIDHTSKGEKLKLKIGEAFDIVVTDVQTENKKISKKVYEQEFEVTVKNKKNENIVVDVEKVLGLNWEILGSSIKYEKLNAQQILFKVPVKAESKTVLKYKVRYSN